MKPVEYFLTGSSQLQKCHIHLTLAWIEEI